MKISVNWLKDFVFLPDVFDTAELAVQLTMHSVQVEGMEKMGEHLDGIVVGKITSVKKHPNADKLKLCVVDIGVGMVPVVCGGSNLQEGMKVALARVGAQVRWHGEGDLIELKETKIRGEISEGMICASDEIGLASMFPKSVDNEIVDLTAIDAKSGTALKDALGQNDVVIDIENKTMTHRPDLWGHYGMAREIAAIQRKKLKAYKTTAIKAGTKQKIRVKIEDDKLCRRYMAVMLEGVHIEASPLWMQHRLLAVGVRPINNIVDISNYVMLELGQPMHAFDAAKIKDTSIVVRRAHEGERFTTLNGIEYSLTNEALVIADSEKSVAIAGVKGDMASGVSEQTTSIIFEAANFDPISVRKTAQRLALRTDSSTRFEKSLDPNLCELALRRAVELTKQVCRSAKVVSNIADVGKVKLRQGPIEVSFDFLNKKIGVVVEKKKVVDILERLGFSVRLKKNSILVGIPTWRATKDISIKEDIVEEVARIYGYGAIPVTLPSCAISPPPQNKLREIIQSIQTICAHDCGLNETMNYSFVSPELLQKLEVSVEDHIELENPVAKDRPYLRRYLMPNLLERLEENVHRFDTVGMFEVGCVFRSDFGGERVSPRSNELLPRQDTYLGIVFASKDDDIPFYKISSVLRTLFERLHTEYELVSVEKPDSTFIHPGRFACVMVEDTEIGRIGELHPRLQNTMGIPHRVGMLELNINDLVGVLKPYARYRPLPVFPEVERDIAFVVAADLPHKDVERTLYGIDNLVVAVRLFDVFVGTNVKEGCKSMAYRITYRAPDKTLETKEVDAIHKKLISTLEKHFHAQIRT